ncbi:hypothetical protein AVEN_5133-1, partial [Araneus ventricosus]
TIIFIPFEPSARCSYRHSLMSDAKCISQAYGHKFQVDCLQKWLQLRNPPSPTCNYTMAKSIISVANFDWLSIPSESLSTWTVIVTFTLKA